MKKVLIITMCLFVAFNGKAQNDNDSSTYIPSLDEIIEAESSQSIKQVSASNYKKIWGKTTFVNFCYATTSLESDEFPVAEGNYSDKFKNKYGVGIQSGNSYNFHKKPIGTVLFIGLDYLPLDLNMNKFEGIKDHPLFIQSEQKPYSLPWHNDKMTFDYSMALGPSLTFYPFTAIGNKFTDNIRLHFYYHVGYSIGLTLINDVNTKDKETKIEFAWNNGLYTSFGFNLSWNGIGLGYEARNCKKLTHHPLSDDYNTGDFDSKYITNRFYIQYRY